MTGELARALLEQAKANLAAHFAVVGLMERYDARLLLMQKTFGWKTPYYVAQNVSEGRAVRSQISDADLATIAEHNQLDLELYAFAERLFEQKRRRQGPLFPLRVMLFSRLNQRQSGRNQKLTRPN